MSEILSFAILMVGAFMMVLIAFTSKNRRWSTADFWPIVIGIVVGSIFSVLIDLLLQRGFGVDAGSIPTAIGLIIAGCCIRWYRTRTQP